MRTEDRFHNDFDEPERNVKNYALFCAGDLDPATGKRIERIIASDPDFIVYLDEDNRIEWSVTEDYETVYQGYSDQYGKVLNKITQLEGSSEMFDMKDKQEIEYRLLLGAALGRMLEKEDQATIEQALDVADQYLNSRMAEKARMWFLTSASLITLCVLILLSLSWFQRTAICDLIGKSAFELSMAMGVGSLGALVSVLGRSGTLSVNISAGKTIHYFEGTVRIFLGMLGALLVGLAIKGNFILGAVATPSHPFTTLLLFSMIGGASERIAPSLIHQVEGLVEKRTR